MNLKERKRNKSKHMGLKKILCVIGLCCIFMSMGITTFAASSHTTRPVLTVTKGNYNPFVHDNAKLTVQFCTKHKKKPNCSKVDVTVEVKTNKRYSKVIKKRYTSSAIGIKQNAPTYTEYNKGNVVKLTVKTNVSDKYVTSARYSTRDFYCVSCQAEDIDYGTDKAEKYCNKTSKWVKEK